MEDFIRNPYAMHAQCIERNATQLNSTHATQQPLSAYRYASNTQTQATQLDAKPKTQQTHQIEPNPILSNQRNAQPMGASAFLLSDRFFLFIYYFAYTEILYENGELVWLQTVRWNFDLYCRKLSLFV